MNMETSLPMSERTTFEETAKNTPKPLASSEALTYPAKVHLPPSPRSEDPEKLNDKDTSFDESTQNRLSSIAQEHINAAHIWEGVQHKEVDREGLLKILLHLALANPFVALLLSIYTLFASLTVTILAPISHCSKGSRPLSSQLASSVTPVLRFQLNLIRADPDLHVEPVNWIRVFGIAMLSPIFAFGVMLVAWVAALFWIYTTILGEPNQRAGKEVDGKSAVRWVKKLWERWLLSGLHG